MKQGVSDAGARCLLERRMLEHSTPVYIFLPAQNLFLRCFQQSTLSLAPGTPGAGCQAMGELASDATAERTARLWKDTKAKSVGAQLLVSCACEEDTCKTPSACAARAPAGLARKETVTGTVATRERCPPCIAVTAETPLTMA